MTMRKSLCLTLTLGLILVSAATAKPKDNGWEAELRAGRLAMENGDYAAADRSLSEALSLTRFFKDDDPRMGATYQSLGNLNVRQQNYAKAADFFQRGLNLIQKLQGAESLDVADCLYGLSLCNQQLGDHLAAEIFLKRVYEIWNKKLGPSNPRLISILPAMAAYKTLKSDTSQSEQYYRQIVNIQEKELGSDNPKLGANLNLLANTLGTQGKFDEATKFAERAVVLLKKDPAESIALDGAQTNLAYLKQQAEPAKEAPPAEPVKVTIESPLPQPQGKPAGPEPKTENRQNSWGKVRYLAGGKLMSKEEYKALLLANEAYEMMRSEKYRMAKDILNRALSIYPDLPSVQTNLGLVLARMGESQEAIQHLKKSIELDSNRPAPWVNLASTYQATGELENCVSTFKEYLSRFPNDGLAPKAKLLLGHLEKELSHQKMVEKVALASNSETDYLPYVTFDSTLKWPISRFPLKVFVADGTGVPGFKPEYKGFFQNSFKQWANATNGELKFEFVTKPESADIECLWTNDLNKVSSPSEGGETILKNSERGIEHANIYLLTCDPSPDSPLSPNQVQAVCLHEAGHALGLVGHSPKPKDIMFCSMPSADVRPEISRRDTDTLKHLYSPQVLVAYKPGGGRSENSSEKLAVLNKGMDYLAREDYEHAVLTLEQALKLDPASETAKDKLGAACTKYAERLEEQGKGEQAESYFKRAVGYLSRLKNRSLRASALKSYAEFLRKQNRSSEAEKLLEETN